MCQAELRAANSCLLKALILDALDNYRHSWPDDLFWERIRDAVVQPGARAHSREDLGAAEAHAVWDATADALEVTLTRTCAMLLAITPEEVTAVAEHAISQRREVVQERTTGKNESPRQAAVVELRTPHREAKAVQELFRQLSPRIEQAEATQSMHKEEGAEVTGTSQEPEGVLLESIWPDLTVDDIQNALGDIAIQNAAKAPRTVSSYTGWHDSELEASYTELYEARGALFDVLEIVSRLEGLKEAAIQTNIESKAEVALLEKKARAMQKEEREALTQHDVRQFAKEQATTILIRGER